MVEVNFSGAPAAQGRQSEPHTHRKVRETHELIFSWLSWLAVLLEGAYDDDGDEGGVAQHGGHTQNNGLTETYSLGLPCTFLINRGYYTAARRYEFYVRVAREHKIRIFEPTWNVLFTLWRNQFNKSKRRES